MLFSISTSDLEVNIKLPMIKFADDPRSRYIPRTEHLLVRSVPLGFSTAKFKITHPGTSSAVLSAQ